MSTVDVDYALARAVGAATVSGDAASWAQVAIALHITGKMGIRDPDTGDFEIHSTGTTGRLG